MKFQDVHGYGNMRWLLCAGNRSFAQVAAPSLPVAPGVLGGPPT